MPIMASCRLKNTAAGRSTRFYDLLSCAQLSMWEEVLRIEHCLLGLEEMPLNRIRQDLFPCQALTGVYEFIAALPELPGSSVYRFRNGG